VKHPELLQPYREYDVPTRLGGVELPLLPFLVLANHDEKNPRPLLVILPEKRDADRVVNDLLALAPKAACAFVGRDLLDGLDRGRSAQALRDLMQSRPGIYVTTARELLGGLDARALARLDLIVGEEYDLRRLEDQLQEFGFERESFVVEPGVFALRGGILDVFPGEAQHPIRLDFLGGTLESAKQFDPGTQRSLDTLTRLTIFSQSPYSDGGAYPLLEQLPAELDVMVHDHPLAGTEMRSVLEALQSRHPVRLSVLDPSRPPETAIWEMEIQPDFQRNLEAVRARLDYLNNEGYEVFLAADSAVQIDRLQVLFADQQFTPIVLSLSSGFVDHRLHRALFTDHQIFGRSRRRSLIPRLFPTKPVTTVDGFQEGDFVVHLDYGIGKYLGIELIPVSGMDREVLAIEFQNQDRIYVPVDKMDRVHKYESSADIPPRLTKLRTTEWEQIKLRTRKAVDNYAKELMELYAQRFVVDGYSFSPDGELQRRMEAAFMYTETSDQLKAVEEIKRDMESQRPMDRLLCGDVGFGKTEVALRAAFKAISDSKQVGVLVPTTVLAQQHYETFAERLEEYPVNVAVISRFKSTAQIHKTLNKLELGEIDLLVGTHRLLSKDVHFKRLGLLIIDEEHRFGVKHKERIKELKTSVDSLAMTATPIPRTLQMSLMGARDLSMLKTPPRERQPIETVVTEFSDRVIRNAVLREVDRGGQVFFVHNRVESIGIMLQRLQHILPEIRFGLGHGQMKPTELERVMLGFFHHEYDVLLSTTIIESGLDIPNANTLIVNRADAMGLSQLYQLRGRVGRSNRKAWAYFLAPDYRKLSHNAIRRLNALERHAHYGGGYEIAMRDLEIRGAGNIFGTEQSGHIMNVGYHLYSRILQDTLDRLRETYDDDQPRFPKPELTLDRACQIPRGYVEDSTERLALYRRLAEADTIDTINEIKSELRDRFGNITAETMNLLLSSLLVVLGRPLGLRSITVKGQTSQGDFHPEYVEQAGAKIIQRLSSGIETSRLDIQIMNNQSLTFLVRHKASRHPLDDLRIFLESMT